MTNLPLHIRLARPDDAASIAFVHVSSWWTSYQDLIPHEILSAQDVEKRTLLWQEILHKAEGPTLVAECEIRGRPMIVGFANGGKNRVAETACDGELYALYLLQEVQGFGIGQELTGSFITEMRRQGWHKVMMWVLTTNIKAQKFYQKMGAQLLPYTKEDVMCGHSLPHVSYGWDFTTLDNINKNREYLKNK